MPSTINTARRSRRMTRSVFELAPELGIAPRAIEHLPLHWPQAASDVVAARAPHHRQHAGVEQLFLERADHHFSSERSYCVPVNVLKGIRLTLLGTWRISLISWAHARKLSLTCP
jgi:hypothetical protein